jgi:hypothetical protein
MCCDLEPILQWMLSLDSSPDVPNAVGRVSAPRYGLQRPTYLRFAYGAGKVSLLCRALLPGLTCLVASPWLLAGWLIATPLPTSMHIQWACNPNEQP